MSKKKRNNTWIYILVGVILILLGVTIYQARTKPRGERVTVEPVKKRTIREVVSASGKIFPQTEVAISSDVSGEIVDLRVEEGDSVQSGQLLVRVDPEAFESQVERGQANVNSARAQLANAKAQVENSNAQLEQIEAQLINAREIHERNEELYDQGVISEADYQASLSNMRALEANKRSATASVKAAEQNVASSQYSVKSAQASLNELKTSLRRTSIYAPMNGIISQLSVEEGERVVGTIQMAGTEMMRIANLNAMEVRVDVSENDIPRVSIGDEVTIEVDAYLDRKFGGRVTQIANSATNTATATLTSDQVTNFEVRINIDPDTYQDLVTPTMPYPFRPGMSASVEINTETREGVLSVPIQAVTTRERKEVTGKEDIPDADEVLEVVFKVSELDTVEIVEVRTGIQDDTYLEIRSGLQEGTNVVTGPYNAIARKLEKGDRIQRVEEDKLYSDKN